MKKSRNYGNTPLYAGRLNRVRDAEICEWLEAAIETSKAQDGSGFPDVLRELVEYRMRKGGKPSGLSPERRMERLIAGMFNEKLEEIKRLIERRSFASAGAASAGNGFFTADDVTGLIDDDDIEGLLEEMNGDW